MRFTIEDRTPFPLEKGGVDSKEKSSASSGGSRVEGLCHALKADRVSVADRVQIESLLEKLRKGAYHVDPFDLGDGPDCDSPQHMLKIYADKYAGVEPEGNTLAKRARVDRSTLYVGMRVKGFAGTLGRITKVKEGAVEISYEDGTSGTTLSDHVEAA